jgi:hypothetical protein
MTESVKDRDLPHHEGEETNMPKAAPAAAGGMGFILVIILVFALFAFLPVSPSMTLTFEVKTQTNYPQTITVGVLSTYYQKISFVAYFVSERDTLLLTPTTGQPGTYALQIMVKYSGVQISLGDFSNIGDGVYQLKVNYFPRSEQRAVPYQVDITLIASGKSYPVTALVFPS